MEHGASSEGGSTTRVGNVENGPPGYPLGFPTCTHCNTHVAFFLVASETEFWEPELHALKVLPLDVPIKQEETQIKIYLYTTEECRETHLKQTSSWQVNTTHISMAIFMATSYYLAS